RALSASASCASGCVPQKPAFARSGVSGSTANDALSVFLADARVRVDAVLEAWGRRAGEHWPSPLADAMRYGMLGAGKRLRAALVLACYDAGARAATPPEGVLELAAAVEG